MKILTRNNLLIFSGIAFGITGGYLYYHFVGCQNGTCAITSNPWLSMLWGGAVGYLVFDMFKGKKKKEPSSEEIKP